MFRLLDTALSATDPVFRMLRAVAEIDQVLFGTDFPYLRRDLAVNAKQRISESSELNHLEKRAVLEGNAGRLFPRLQSWLKVRVTTASKTVNTMLDHVSASSGALRPLKMSEERNDEQDLGVWTYENSALVLIDYQKEMFETIRSETSAELADLNVRLLARTATAFNMPVVLSTVGVKLYVQLGDEIGGPVVLPHQV